ncbi:hypothetical protein [Streptomyces sp. NBC_00083]|uniref:hypothetical protein n=1 Tax=Streptomyces sp. NBC_00083 TaxID=2975647 RepID=UPI002255BDB1|nr:hypothetical protein [Streptomyces sp. NBC_00083]MCX5386647.1 hypothetical protein [Streptomyces sp. NBC_00083]
MPASRSTNGTEGATRAGRRPRTLVLAAVAIAVALGFAAVVAVPAATDWYKNRHDESASYTSGKEAKADRSSVPRWLPDEAKHIEYAMRTTGGDRLLKATLPAASPPATCASTTPSPSPHAPGIRSSWFPREAGQRPTVRCGLYYAYMDGHTLYAWQANADWVAANRG